MKIRISMMAMAAGIAVILLGTAGCESTGSSTYVGSSYYYGSGWNDPYYYRRDYYYGRVVVPPGYRPPGNRPPGARPPPGRPVQLPAARPQMPSRPRPRPAGRR